MDTRKKIVSWSALKRRITVARRQGIRIGFTNGCFDILHSGHVRYLESAKKKSRLLVIGLNSDSSVKRIKGPQRPVNSQEQRAEVLAALACVDLVAIFEEDTPYELISRVIPDVLIKGADWKGREVVGSDIVRANGGKVELIKYFPQFSTTKTIKRIIKRGKS